MEAGAPISWVLGRRSRKRVAVPGRRCVSAIAGPSQGLDPDASFWANEQAGRPAGGWFRTVAQVAPDESHVGDHGTPAYAERRIQESLQRFWSFKQSISEGRDFSLGGSAVGDHQ